MDLATEGEDRRSDLISTVTPEISVRGSGGRVSLDLDYSLLQSFYKNDSNRRDTQNSLAANGLLEFWDRIAFIEAQAGISRQLTSSGSASTDSLSGQQKNRTEVRTLSLSPYFLHHFGTWVETESRLTLSKTMTDGDVANTLNNQDTFLIKSGRRFTRLLWNATLDSGKLTRSDSTSTNRNLRSSVDFTYVVNPKISLLFGGGYEKTEDGTLTDEPKGPIWDVGVDLRPGRKTSLRLTYGDRFETKNFGLDASHQLSSRTSISASFSESIQTSQQAISQDLSFIGTDPAGNLIDTRTGLPFTAGGGGFGLATEAFRQKLFSLQISGSRRRNTFSGGISWESRKTDTTGVEEIVREGNINLSRQMTPRVGANLGLSYSMTDFGTLDSRVAKDMSVSAGLNYRIFRDIQGTLNYILTKRKDDVGGSGLTENAVTVGLQKTF